MSKKVALVVWTLTLILANLFLFTLNRGMTPTFWITFGFVWAAFISVLVFQYNSIKKTKTPDERFLLFSSTFISSIYMVLQIPICILFALGSGSVHWKVALLIHAIIFAAAWILTLGSLAGNEHIKKVDSRQKNHHTEL